MLVLEQTLKDDLSLPINATDFSYDSENQKIRIAVASMLCGSQARMVVKSRRTLKLGQRHYV